MEDISSHAKQENLYAIYETTDRHYWTELARFNQQEFLKSGTEGKCIEARELLPEPIEKIATRNMFYNEQKKHVRTKKIGKNNPKAEQDYGAYPVIH